MTKSHLHPLQVQGVSRGVLYKDVEQQEEVGVGDVEQVDRFVVEVVYVGVDVDKVGVDQVGTARIHVTNFHGVQQLLLQWRMQDLLK